jgi:hypothetical protein
MENAEKDIDFAAESLRVLGVSVVPTFWGIRPQSLADVRAVYDNRRHVALSDRCKDGSCFAGQTTDRGELK